jgi:hypothetical protein
MDGFPPVRFTGYIPRWDEIYGLYIYTDYKPLKRWIWGGPSRHDLRWINFGCFMEKIQKLKWMIKLGLFFHDVFRKPSRPSTIKSRMRNAHGHSRSPRRSPRLSRVTFTSILAGDLVSAHRFRFPRNSGVPAVSTDWQLLETSEWNLEWNADFTRI